MAEQPVTCCARCGGERLTWRIKRNRAALRDSRRELLWSCGGCGHEWTEPLSVAFASVADDPVDQMV